MKTFILIITILAMIGVFASLIYGLINMSKTGKENRKKSNKMMWLRVYVQGIAIALMFVFAVLS